MPEQSQDPKQSEVRAEKPLVTISQHEMEGQNQEMADESKTEKDWAELDPKILLRIKPIKS
jgi:hypothetical protein